jgi:uncharacterized protein
MTRIGLISDTHGLMRAEALRALDGSNFIVHAGDIGDASILDRLRDIAPVTAVRGNNDRGAWATALPDSAELIVDGRVVHVLHAVQDLQVDAREAGFDVVVAGHSHRPSIETRGGVLFVNPGSAGPRRFRLPVSVGRLVLTSHRMEPALIELSIPAR